MRAITLFLLFALIVLFSSPSLSSASSLEDIFVFDIGIHPVEYYDYSYTMTGGPLCGKVNISPRQGSTKLCRFDITQDHFRSSNGVRFTFIPIGNNPPGENRIYIKNSTFAIYSPAEENLCFQSSIWKVSRTPGFPTPVITIGGSLDDTSSSCFRFVRPKVPAVALRTYIIEHCPYLCSGGNDTCYQVGISKTKDGYNQLSYNATYLEVAIDNIDNNPSLTSLRYY